MRRRLTFGILIAALVLTGTLATLRYAYAHVRISTDLKWTEDIRPIFRKKCMSCHSPTGVAPDYIDFTTYGAKPGQSGARDWAKSIEEEILTGRMPPWQADDRYGSFANERKLTQLEIDYIIAWIQGGAPQGRRDVPAPPEFIKQDWAFGEPDLVVTPLVSHVIPADANEDFVSVRIPIELEKDQWITGYEFLAGNPRIVHSVVAYIHDPEGAPPEVLEIEHVLEYDPLADEDDLEEILQRTMPAGPHFLAQWTRGDEPVLLPDEAGKRLRKGSTIELQITYRKLSYEDEGKEFTDDTKLGLHFGNEDIDLIIEAAEISGEDFTIPAGEVFEVKAEHILAEDARLIGISPQMGWLGRRFEATAHYPDGRESTLLFIPEYDHKWASTFIFERPIRAPKGTRIEIAGVYDNTPGNRNNFASPPQDVPSGRGAGKARFVAWIDYTLDTHLYVPTPTPTPKPIVKDDTSSGMLSFDFSIKGEGDGVEVTLVDQAGTDIRDALTEPETLEFAALSLFAGSEEIHWCPMRGIGDGQCGLVDHQGPGRCDICGMTLKPKSFFMERYGDKHASAEKRFPLTKRGLESIYWCPNRARPDHELTEYAGPGECEVCGEQLMHKTRFEDVKTWVCLTEECPIKGTIYYAPGNCPTCGEPVQSMGHMDHNPVHNGQLIMADNLYHHVEGTLTETDAFRLYFYDDWKNPLDPRNFAGKLIIERFDEATEELLEEEYPLSYIDEGDPYLTANIPPVEEFPVNFSTEIYLAGKETIFSFAFEDVTPEEAQGPTKAIRLHGHLQRGELIIPETPADMVAEILTRDAIIAERIAAQDWFGLHNPAFDAKDLAEALELKPEGLGVRERGKLRKAVARLTQGAIFLDNAGDSEDEPRVTKAYATFSEGIEIVRTLYPQEE